MEILENKKVNILKDILGPYRKEGDEYLFKCPFCNHHKKKLSINIKKDVAKCWICEWSTGSLYKLILFKGSESNKSMWSEFDDRIRLEKSKSDFMQMVKEDDIIDRKNNSLYLPDGFKTIVSSPNKEVMRYLMGRGVDLSDFYRWQIGYALEGKYAGRVIFPSFNENGYLNHFVGRAFWDSKFPKYMTPPVSKKDIIFNDLYINWDRPLTIVEGVFDAVKAGYNSIPILGKSISEKSKLFKKIVENGNDIYIALDQGEDKSTSRMVDLFRDYNLKCFVVKLPEHVEDVGEMSKEEFRRCKEQNSKETTKDSLIKNKILGEL